MPTGCLQLRHELTLMGVSGLEDSFVGVVATLKTTAVLCIADVSWLVLIPFVAEG